MFFHQSPPAPLAIATRAKIARLPGPDQPRQKWNRQRKAARNAFRSDHQLIDCFFCGGCLLPSAGLYGWRMNNSRRRISKVSPFALAWNGDDDCNICAFGTVSSHCVVNPSPPSPPFRTHPSAAPACLHYSASRRACVVFSRANSTPSIQRTHKTNKPHDDRIHPLLIRMMRP